MSFYTVKQMAMRYPAYSEKALSLSVTSMVLVLFREMLILLKVFSETLGSFVCFLCFVT